MPIKSKRSRNGSVNVLMRKDLIFNNNYGRLEIEIIDYGDFGNDSDKDDNYNEVIDIDDDDDEDDNIHNDNNKSDIESRLHDDVAERFQEISEWKRKGTYLILKFSKR